MIFAADAQHVGVRVRSGQRRAERVLAHRGVDAGILLAIIALP